MKIRHARLSTKISLRGHSFDKGDLIKVWDAGNSIGIQPYHCKPLHDALWYALPAIHHKHIQYVEHYEENLIDCGII